MQKGLHWSQVFTGRLSEDVKLVGSTISCETAYMGGRPGNEARHNAHVQSYVMATDQVQCTPFHVCVPLLSRSCSVGECWRVWELEARLSKQRQLCTVGCYMQGGLPLYPRWLVGDQPLPTKAVIFSIGFTRGWHQLHVCRDRWHW